MSNFMIVSLIFLASFEIGCSQDSPSSPPASSLSRPQTPTTNADAFASRRDADLVRQAVEEHVRNDREVNLSAMDMSVDSVNFNGDQAQANVTFRVKQGGASMEMIYWLERQGKVWQVAKSQPADGHPSTDPTHPSASPNPSVPAMPDVQEFLNNHPATNSNGT